MVQARSRPRRSRRPSRHAPGDIIINYYGQPIQQMEELSRLVTGTAPGTVVPVTVLRKGKEMKFQVKVAELQYKGQETSSL
ncbi:MAG: hypothetical protein B7Z63_06110 [Ignavibacteriae bacterium 37-53-5]|nr:MAG: hypothetical protein B7Z63_06110 [Ignavibacteriae bacterium 37-53-5]